MVLEPHLDTIKALIILDNDGTRILAKYYDSESWDRKAAHKNFEKTLFNKTHKVCRNNCVQIIFSKIFLVKLRDYYVRWDDMLV